MLVWNETFSEFRDEDFEDYHYRTCQRCGASTSVHDSPHGIEDCLRSLRDQVRHLAERAAPTKEK
jgi:hypothetical protein